jgi:hypothetical protein
LTPGKIEKSEDEKNAAGMHRKLVTDLAGKSAGTRIRSQIPSRLLSDLLRERQ